MEDLKNDYLKDRIKDFFMSKNFVFICIILACFSLFYINTINKKNKESEKIMLMLLNSDESMDWGDIPYKTGDLYVVPKFIMISNLISRRVNILDKDFNRLLTSIKSDDNFGVLAHILYDFYADKKIIKFSSINSPWSELIKELNVINLKSTPNNLNMLPLLASNNISVKNPFGEA